jgi:hypothetical protein
MDNDVLDQLSPAKPTELSGRTPRKVRLKLDRGDVPLLLLIILLFGVGGCAFFGWICYYDLNQFYQRATLRSEGQEVLGEVTGFTIHRNAPLGIWYQFVVDGRTYSAEALQSNTPVPGLKLEKGDSISILYLPSNPNISHPARWEWTVSTAWYTILYVVGGIAVGIFCFASLLKDRRLARNASAACGIVTSCARDGKLNCVAYKFTTGDGALAIGSTKGPDEYLVGERIWILYLPDKPQRNSRYPLDFFEVIE